MRNIISHAMVLMLLVAASVANAQGYTFRVLANKGENMVKKAGTAGAVQLKTGATLNSEDLIISTDDSYIGLMHKTGKTTEIRGAGTKRVSDIEKQVQITSTSVSDRYATFVMNKMNESENSDVRSKMAATGAVKRDIKNANAINVMAPEAAAEVLGDVTIIRWNKADSMVVGDSYRVEVKNIFDEVIYELTTTKTSVELDFTIDEMKNESGLYLIKVYKSNDEEITSSEVAIKKIKSSDKREVQANLAALKAEVSDDSPLNKLILASFFEENELILDALTKYEEAIRMAPDVEDFQQLYTAFLLKNGLIVLE
jgi:hypothetical protein